MKGEALNRDDVDCLFAELAAALGLESLTLDDDLTCCLEVEDGMSLSLTYFPAMSSILMVTPIVSADSLAPDILEIALGQNLDWASNGDGVFSIPPGGNHLCFSRLCDASHGSVETFRQELVAFAHAVMEVFPFLQNQQQQQQPRTGEFMQAVSPFV